MGWRRVSVLEVDTDDAVEQCGLWTRGGINGVQVRIEDKVISIPRELILELVAQEYVSVEITRLEQMTTEQFVSMMMGRR